MRRASSPQPCCRHRIPKQFRRVRDPGTRIEAIGPEEGRVDEHWSKGRTVTRLATAGLAVVLLALTGFSLWVAYSTNRVARQADRFSRLSDAYQQARFAVAAEESLERKYRLEPGPEVRQRYQQAAAALGAALDVVHERGNHEDQVLVGQLDADHARYLDAIGRMFAAVDAGETERVLTIDTDQVDPLFSAIETRVNAAADAHRAQALASLAALRHQETFVMVATPIAFAFGLGLLGMFWATVVGYQRRTQRQAAENQHQALHDGLTGLPNRTLLRDRTDQAIHQADRELVPAALLLVDLDRFKEVNDALGHHYGDQLLVQVGQRLRAPLREVDTVARLGGDEFAILFAGAAPEAIIIDPGIGFGKTIEHNLQLLRGLPVLAALGQPLLVGVSRKAFIGKILNLAADERLEGSIAAAVAAALAGANILRVHDVPETYKAVRVADAIRFGFPQP